MPFASEAQKRWYFANKGGGSGGSVSFSSRQLPPSSSPEMKAALRARAQHDAVALSSRALPPSSSPEMKAALRARALRDSREAAVAQADMSAAWSTYRRVENESVDRQADYWSGGSSSEWD